MANYSSILSEELFFSLIDHITQMVVGVEKIIGIYSHPDKEELCGISLEYRNNKLQEHVLNLSNLEGKIDNIRQQTSSYKWLDKNQIPFNTAVNSKVQLNIFDEYEHLVLLVALPGDNMLKDILMIYFKDDINSFGVQHQKSSLSTDNKSIIGQLVSGSVNSYCNLYAKEKAQMNRFVQKTQNILSAQRTDNEDTIRKKQLEEVIYSYANEYIQKRNESEGVNYVYSEEAVRKIKNYVGAFSNFKQAIEEAVDYAQMIITDVTKVIQAEFIQYITDVNSELNYSSNNDSIALPLRLQKVYDFMERLEAACISVNKSKLNLTGVNVGGAMDTPISAAAISDYTSKNRERINTLFDQYPEKWSFSKNNFKSIINISVQNHSSLRNWS
ncbi:hypothetical protein [Labilibacter marinus]|uniref:hypothetical protein n=1 Tax=Labilibacter marinus TaxID=1477105 RepID=UPI00082D4434|nr:hypothetical protein [Labilibacter marinus]